MCVCVFVCVGVFVCVYIYLTPEFKAFYSIFQRQSVHITNCGYIKITPTIKIYIKIYGHKNTTMCNVICTSVCGKNVPLGLSSYLSLIGIKYIYH